MVITHDVVDTITKVYARYGGRLRLIHANTDDYAKAREVVISYLREQNIKHGAVMAVVRK